jgi:hypothetical protein
VPVVRRGRSIIGHTQATLVGLGRPALSAGMKVRKVGWLTTGWPAEFSTSTEIG